MSEFESPLCKDCGVDIHSINELCYINDALWKYVCSRKPEIDTRYVLCIGCIEKRLGRQLTPNDFVSCELNGHDFGRPKSDRLKDRLGIKRASLKLWT